MDNEQPEQTNMKPAAASVLLQETAAYYRGVADLLAGDGGGAGGAQRRSAFYSRWGPREPKKRGEWVWPKKRRRIKNNNARL